MNWNKEELLSIKATCKDVNSFEIFVKNKYSDYEIYLIKCRDMYDYSQYIQEISFYSEEVQTSFEKLSKDNDSKDMMANQYVFYKVKISELDATLKDDYLSQSVFRKLYNLLP